MANQFNTHPFTLTTTMASPFRTLVANATNVLQVKKLQWTGGTATQTCVIGDGHGNLLFQLLAVTGADSILDFPEPQAIADFQVTTLASGTLIIYLM